jgi:hypothetical protein
MKSYSNNFRAFFASASVAGLLLGNAAFASRLTNESFRFEGGVFAEGAGNTALITDSVSMVFQEVGAFPLVPFDPSKPSSSQPMSFNAALVETRPLGNYSAEGTTFGGTDNGVILPNSSGVMLMELYDINRSPGARLGNISGRSICGNSPSNGIIIGFNIAADDQGGAPMQLLIRGIGPALLEFGLVDAQPAAVLDLIDSSGNEIASNSGWDTNPPSSTTNGIVVQPATAAIMSGAGAFPLKPGSKDAAFVVTLPVGSYTFLVHGPGFGTGSAEGEVYVIP